ncbi:MAG TPA: hypothetical protein DEF35_08315 [Paenibacillus sp.]|uniref:hypothetical protein n=1 Tax=Paenibacillus TaxID=44249 RepID=UPI000B9FBC51|nr:MULTISPECIES: hypothetical protein [Paenibacillus]OZQ67078.1 hypothetical protein CA599_17875 [Paenibacillus taichungensis]HBU81626.1 hypothetical protein [Paenibacillus sp.]
MSLKRAVYFLSLIIGIVFVALGVIPAIFAYPYSAGPNSGPVGFWELILITSYEQWTVFLIVGMILSLFLILKRQRVT